jgi:hypothetical protein
MGTAYWVLFGVCLTASIVHCFCKVHR